MLAMTAATDREQRTARDRLPQCSLGSRVRTAARMAKHRAAPPRMACQAAKRVAAPGATEANSKSSDASARTPQVYQARKRAVIPVFPSFQTYPSEADESSSA